MDSAGDALKSCRKVLKAAGQGNSQYCAHSDALRRDIHTQLGLIVNARLVLKQRHLLRFRTRK